MTRVDDIVRAVYDSVDTDMSLENALGFVKPALNVELSGITMLNMQGTPYRNGMYYSLNKAENLKIVNTYFNIFTHDLNENAVSVEELVQSTAANGDASKGHTMEDIDENQIDLGFIKGGGHSGTSHAGSSTGSGTVNKPEPSVPTVAEPEQPEQSEQGTATTTPDAQTETTPEAGENPETASPSENPDGENPPEKGETPAEPTVTEPEQPAVPAENENAGEVPPPAAA